MPTVAGWSGIALATVGAALASVLIATHDEVPSAAFRARAQYCVLASRLANRNIFAVVVEVRWIDDEPVLQSW